MNRFSVLLILLIAVSLSISGCGGGGSNNGDGGNSNSATLIGSWAGTFKGTNHSVTLTVTISSNGTASGTIYNSTDSVPGVVSGTANSSGNINLVFYYESGGVTSPAPGAGDYMEIGTITISNSGNLVGSYTEYDDTGRTGLQGTVVATGTINLTPAVPPTVNVTGIWQGTVSDTYAGTANVTFNANEVALGIVTGEYTISTGTGSTLGTLSGNTVSFSLSPTGCTGTLNGIGTVIGNSMNISYSGIYSCNGTVINDSGSGILTNMGT